MLTFAIARHGNPNVSPVLEMGETLATLKALLIVTASGDGGGDDIEMQIGMMIDCSGSMSGDNDPSGNRWSAKRTRMDASKDALRTAISLLPPRVRYFLARFTDTAEIILPPTLADEVGKAQGLKMVSRLQADGGTVMSAALRTIVAGFGAMPPASPGKAVVRVVLFLSDGENDVHDRAFDDELARSREVARFWCRGLGTDWNSNGGALSRIRNVTLGTLELVPGPSEMEASFRKDVAAALNIGASNVRLRLTIPPVGGVVIRSVWQRLPGGGNSIDLTGRGEKVDEATTDFPLGPWKAEERKYRIELSTPPGREGTNKRLGKCSLVMDGPQGLVEVSAPPLLITWNTGDESLVIDPEIARDEGQTEMSEAIQLGLRAKERGDRGMAEAEFGRAMRLAREGGHAEMSVLLEKQVSVGDDGSVVLREDASKVDDMTIDLGSQTLD